MKYRGWIIEDSGFRAHPNWRASHYLYTHGGYDGPEDNRIGHARTIEKAKQAIDEYYLDRLDERVKP